MKYVKILGLAAVAAMAMMAFAGSASATQLDKVTSGGAKDTLGVGTTLHVTQTSGTTLNLTDTAGNPIDTCKESTVHGTIANAGGSGATVSGNLTETTGLTWGGCTSPTVTLAAGSLEIHGIAGTDNGTVTGKNNVVTISVFGVSCRYGTGAGTDLGLLTGTTSATGHATMAINAIINEQEPKQFLCPDTGKWVGGYTVTTPTGLYVTP
jgi:hypothetical protein